MREREGQAYIVCRQGSVRQWAIKRLLHGLGNNLTTINMQHG